jgi:hypothetical protein
MLDELTRLRLLFGGATGARRRALVRALDRAALPRARDVLALHELLVFARAYPDDAGTLELVDAALARFASRPDVRRFRRALADTGIAGTDIHYELYYPTAVDLARRFPDRLRVDWPAWAGKRDLVRYLPLLVPFTETPALDEMDLGPRAWIDLLRGGVADGAFLALRFAAMDASPFVRESLYDTLSPAMVLRPGPGTPNRTHAKAPVPRVVFQRGPLDAARPDLAREVPRIPVTVHEVSAREGARYVDMVREAMVTRARDLDAFSHATAGDVRLCDLGEGLSLAVLGVEPDRRLLLECVYGALTLKNGVPIGYVLFSSLFGSTEVAFNVFDTFRGAEAARVLARVLAAARRLFGTSTFSIDPYQLGHFGNEEGLASGAWWFYYKLGFRPRDRGALRLAARERAAMKRRPTHRSSRATLEALSSEPVFLSLGRDAKAPSLAELWPGRVGAHVARHLAARYGADRERGVTDCEAEARALCGVASLAGWSAGERVAWHRWAPLLVSLTELRRFSAEERRAASEVARAKGGRREADFLARLEAHPKLRRALLRLATPD